MGGVSLQSVQSRIAAACERSNRQVEEVTLVVVTKARSVEQIRALYESGHRDFGENRPQELDSKAGLLPRDIRWHFVGPLQTNKVRLVRPVASLLHSLDRRRLGEAWMKGPGLSPPALLQVNVGGEEQKLGVAPGDAGSVAGELVRIGIRLRGVMTIPPVGIDAARTYFRQLREVRDRLAEDLPEVQELSMGMTDDFEVAIEEGATYIRVGRAIFES